VRREEREAVSVYQTTHNVSIGKRRFTIFAAPGVISHSLRAMGTTLLTPETHSCQERGGFAHARIIGVEHEGIIIILVAQNLCHFVQRQPGAILKGTMPAIICQGCGKVGSLLNFEGKSCGCLSYKFIVGVFRIGAKSQLLHPHL